MDLALVIPIYNEEENIPYLYDAIEAALEGAGTSYEVVAVDDGSSDRGLEQLLQLAERDPRWRIVQLARNFGQHPALAAGLAAAHGDILVTLDADLQIEPRQVLALVEKIREGHDFVGGVRIGSGDSLLLRRLPSALLNLLIGRVAGRRLRDFGCPMNAMRRELAEQLPHYGDMQRFFKPLAVRLAASVAEVEVAYRPRRAGSSKYDFLSLVDLFFDFVSNFSRRLFQRVAVVGLLLFGAGMLGGMAYLLLRFAFALLPTPWDRLQALLLLALLFGLNLTVLGILGDFVIRIYRKIDSKPLYQIKTIR